MLITHELSYLGWRSLRQSSYLPLAWWQLGSVELKWTRALRKHLPFRSFVNSQATSVDSKSAARLRTQSICSAMMSTVPSGEPGVCMYDSIVEQWSMTRVTTLHIFGTWKDRKGYASMLWFISTKLPPAAPYQLSKLYGSPLTVPFPCIRDSAARWAPRELDHMYAWYTRVLSIYTWRSIGHCRRQRQMDLNIIRRPAVIASERSSFGPSHAPS